MEAEKIHADLYSKILQILKETQSDTTISPEWFVCPKCGDLFDNIEEVSHCPICSASSTGFIKF